MPAPPRRCARSGPPVCTRATPRHVTPPGCHAHRVRLPPRRIINAPLRSRKRRVPKRLVTAGSIAPTRLFAS
eukprot:2329945-Rhodomonas_salina.1